MRTVRSSVSFRKGVVRMRKNEQTTRGMWKRTLGIFKKVNIPWHLYILEALLEVASVKVAMLYVPYLADIQTGNVTKESLAGYLGFNVLSLIAGIIAAIPAFYASGIMQKNLQNLLIHHTLHLPMRVYEKYGSKIISWISSDSSFADGLIGTLIGFLTGIAALYMSVKNLAGIDLSFAYIVPFILGYVLFSTWFEGKLLFLREKKGREARSDLVAYLSEHMGFFREVKELHAGKEEAELAEKAIESYYRAEIYQAALTLLNSIVNGSLTTVVSILVFVIGVPKVRDGSIDMASLAAFSSYVSVAYQSFSSIPSLYTSFMYHNGQLFYVASLLDQKEETLKKETGMSEEGSIAFDHVGFSYEEGEKPVLKDVSFTIPEGKVTALIGQNGSGKTTVFKLLERLYEPDGGKILFNGGDASKIHLDEWRRSFGCVSQDPQLMSASVRDNIAYGLMREPETGEVEACAEAAGAASFIQSLPEGYDTLLAEDGDNLSGGQRQRISIARTLMCDPEVLLLDEHTSSLDVVAEKEVMETLLKVMKGRTVVMITHDLALLEHADHVIVMKDGTVEAEGSLDEVKNESSVLRRMLEAEKGGEENEVRGCGTEGLQGSAV